MFILILGAAILAMVICIIIASNTEGSNYEFTVHGLFFGLSWFFGIVVVAMIITICCVTPKVATAYTIDKEIIMYEEENKKIEEQINVAVKEYMKHEKETFESLKTEESAITLVTLYPELKSDTLVQEQLELYVDNNEHIKYLKTEKIEISKLRWLLYFGK